MKFVKWNQKGWYKIVTIHFLCFQPETLNEIELSKLVHGARYKFGVSAVIGSQVSAESETKWTHFTVPSCLMFYPANLNICSKLYSTSINNTP